MDLPHLELSARDKRNELKSPTDGWQEEALARVRARWWVRKSRQRLPLSNTVTARLSKGRPAPGGGESVNAHVRVVRLRDRKDWVKLHRRFTANADQNFSPFNRCLSVLYENGARTCVIEEHYVCLDYKSEMLAFYSQLDEARELNATRLHFFAEDVSKKDLHKLGRKKRKSYLGYIVCRDGNLPLVGRSTISTPAYIDVSSDIAETVHFFGQRLEVIGVPFMQQDEHVSLCSQVVVWEAHYAMHRRGLLQRRLVAEIFAMSGAVEPMKPRASEGLLSSDVSLLFSRSGLSSRTYNTPESGDIDLPMINMESIEGYARLIEDARRAMKKEKKKRRRQIDSLAFSFDEKELRAPEVNLAEFAADLSEVARTVSVDHPLHKCSNQLFDRILAFIMEPYLRSRTPIYAGTANHALLFCGITRSRGRTTFFAHDDQYGPYLAMESLLDASRTSLASQGYFSASYPQIRRALPDGGHNIVFPTDVTKHVSDYSSPFTPVDRDRAVRVLVIPGPPRLVLTPAEAEADAFRLLGKEVDASWRPSPRGSARLNWSVRTTILMGIDYKALRRQHLLRMGDRVGAQVFSQLHLAEWVVVVEQAGAYLDAGMWEIVYDGTSGSRVASTQLARFGRRLVVDHPLMESVSQEAVLKEECLPHLEVPMRAGKAVG